MLRISSRPTRLSWLATVASSRPTQAGGELKPSSPLNTLFFSCGIGWAIRDSCASSSWAGKDNRSPFHHTSDPSYSNPKASWRSFPVMAESWRICKICVTQLVSDSHVDSAQPRSPAKQSGLMSLVFAEIAVSRRSSCISIRNDLLHCSNRLG